MEAGTKSAGLPGLTPHGLLPPGIHDASLDEVERVFGGFSRTDRRPRLFANLRSYAAELARAGWRVELLLDGSFVMAGVDEPQDIDLVLVLPEDWDIAADVRPFEYNLLSSKRVRRQHGFDLFTVTKGSDREQAMVAFFSGMKEDRCVALQIPLEARKGLIRVIL